MSATIELPLAPTPERQRRSTFEAPAVTRAVVRRNFRALSAFETLLRRGEIDLEQLAVAEKFERHLQGSLGHDVRHGDGNGGEPLELAQTYHAQQLAAAATVLGGEEMQAMTGLVIGNADLYMIGNRRRPSRKREIQRATGLSLVISALDRLVKLWKK